MSRQCAACRPLCIGIPWTIGEFQAECGTGSHELSSAVAMSPSSGGAHAIDVEGCRGFFHGPSGPQRFPQAVDFVTYNNHQILADLPMAEFFETLESVLHSPTCGDQPLVGLFSSL